MTQLLEIKAILVGIYKRFDHMINAVTKFVVSLMIVMKLNAFLGYSSLFSKFTVNVGLALMAAFLPGSWFLLVLIAVVGLQLFSASLEVTIVILILMLIVYFLFARLQPKYAFLVMLTPLLYSMNLIYILPLFAGLFLGITSIIPIGIGIGVYRFSVYLPGLFELKPMDGASLLDSPETLVNMYKYTTNAIIKDETLFLMIIVFALVIVGMDFLKKLEMDYIWYITIGVGAIVMLISFIIGDIVLDTDVSIVGLIIGTLISGTIVAIVQFLRFSLDYKRAEKLQFEDDEYYYYVKTVPKLKATAAQKEVIKIK